MTPDPTRRRVLQLTGAGATASLAGCASILSDDDGDDELQADREPDIDLSEGITAIVSPAQSELEGAQQEILSEYDEEDMSQEEIQEAQTEIQERQMELFVSRSVEFENRLADTDVSVEAAVGEQGAFLLTGPDEELIGLLRGGDVDGLVPGEDYEMVLEPQGGAEPGAEPDPEPDPEEGSDDADADENETAADDADGDDADADGDDSDADTDGDDSDADANGDD